MRTKVCEMLGVELPIFAFSHCRDVVAEVSRAGGFGVLGAIGFTPERLEEELAWIDAHVDGKPYGVDILIPNKYEKTRVGDFDLKKMIPDQNQQFLKRLCEEGKIPELPEGEAILAEELARTRMTPEDAEALVDVALRHPIKMIVNALGTPPKHKVDQLHKHGLLVGSLVGKLDHAKAQVEAGVDILIAQGSEAGGHTGTVSSMVLWPQIVDAVAPVPVLAAGGIGRGRQMAAALALGADGIWCGSVWLGTDKSDLQPELKDRMYHAKSEDAIQSRSLTGKPCRMLRSKFSDAWQQTDAPQPLPMPLQTFSTLETRRRIERAHAADYMSYPVGQIVGDMRHETSIRQVIHEMLEEFIDSFERLNHLLMTD